MNERELIKLKEKIDQAKIKVSELKGKQDYLMQQLKEQYGCSSLEEAKALATKTEHEISLLDKNIKAGLAEIAKKVKNE
jgi:hypothetical protein